MAKGGYLAAVQDGAGVALSRARRYGREPPNKR